MDRLETRELAYFIAVAEELHFGRAAARLGIAQPPLSRAISLLERRLNVRLLERTSRRVSLTPAGQVFLDESRKALNAVDAAVRRAQQASRPNRLVVAVRPGTGSGLLAEVLSAYSRQQDALNVEIAFTHDQPTLVRNGTADIGLMCGNDDLDDLETAELMQENPVSLLPASHRLAERATVTAAELHQEETFCVHCPSGTLDEIVDLVGLGRLIVIVGESAADRVGRAVVTVPVADIPGTLLVLGWSKRAPLAARTAFVRTTRNIAAQRASRQASQNTNGAATFALSGG